MDHGIEGAGVKCGRWNPTHEQLKVLMDLFRSGLRTPTAEQIQRISNQLSAYGKIESKNVFYWFQNHKARERHHHHHHRHTITKKRRRRRRSVTSPSPSSSSSSGDYDDHQATERDELETLELFPLKSFCSKSEEENAQKPFMLMKEYYCKMEHYSSFSNSDGQNVNVTDSRLDLRLSFF